MSEQRRIEVWREPDGFWRWRYVDPHEGVDLLSNESHPTRAEAVHAGSTAYPGVAIVDGPPSVTRLGLARTARRAGAATLAAMAAAAIAPVAAAVARRRRRRHRTG